MLILSEIETQAGILHALSINLGVKTKNISGFILIRGLKKWVLKYFKNIKCIKYI